LQPEPAATRCASLSACSPNAYKRAFYVLPLFVFATFFMITFFIIKGELW
jgi:hypothetical protein